MYTRAIAFICMVFLAGCVQQPSFPTSAEIQASGLKESMAFNIDTTNSKYSDKKVDVSIAPSLTSMGLYKFITLTVVNKTKQDIKIVWDETVFIENGASNGRFMFEGVRYIDRDASKVPDIILPGATFTKAIYPNAKVLNLPYTGGWVHAKFESGEYGVYLSLSGKGVDEKIKVMFKMSR